MNSGAGNAGKTRLLLADDHEMLLEMFAIYLRTNHDFEVVTARSFDEAVERIEAEGPFDVALLDWNMPGMHGVAGLKRALQLQGGRPVGIITGEALPKVIDETVAAGAAGIVLKSSGVRSLVNALNLILSGERYLPFDLVMRRADPNEESNDTLTKREMLILVEIAKGKRNKEICADLRLALPTVKMHVSSLCRKLGAKNRLHATVIARDLGLI
ncbi:response regulator transcription factor [Rhodobacteraceae bacterium HSP-20]|jgi:DNA-binding NarL/FixJ family response regulator|uniref:Response regulator transcription factor n=1 Tax=Paragemmobacter amnigenus TaxID=2852097 RepID=A0ABS6J5W9_9RHOB|nr:response regulator transcription factor [Rhodobacter amnigenus]MBU9699156.1 response regulator transcription factor [Rhodobacter amnigenus]MBV4390383.1 response regulator transcription factor [Rhodobacter amnigenus]